jgi:hypothetical protein
MSSLIVQDPPKKELYGTEQTHQHKKKKASKDDTTQKKRYNKPINNKEKSKRFINKGACRAAEAVMFHSKICHSSQ